MAKKNRIGTGLDELFADNFSEENESEVSEEGTAEGGVITVKLTLLEPNKDQPRENFNDEKLGELADSIKANGLLQPILVRPLDNGGYQIVAGERRWRACRLAGLEEVPVYIKELDDRQTMQMALIENIQRQDLSPVEEAMAYKKLMDTYGLTQQQVAEAVGKSRSAVANSLRVLELDETVRDYVDQGIISFGHAKVLSGLELPMQVAYAMRVKNDGLSVRELEAVLAEVERENEEKEAEERTVLRKRSVKKERPFLKEFEMSVNNSSNVKVKARSGNDGSVRLDVKIGKEMDLEEILGKIAKLLENY